MAQKIQASGIHDDHTEGNQNVITKRSRVIQKKEKENKDSRPLASQELQEVWHL